jgi:hypothetical protein
MDQGVDARLPTSMIDARGLRLICPDRNHCAHWRGCNGLLLSVPLKRRRGKRAMRTSIYAPIIKPYKTRSIE